ncbi:M10 family metallopeptidase C-terminal domain-containing protein [uncultured Maricaulis sp.]|uniref:M10 family metallopeptidase C-terminal domain-containing protein n=1 Tax=uncultured Maricaulis sp. TaxID=174710 RepID=UPI0030D9493E
MTDESWAGSNFGCGEPLRTDGALAQRVTPQDVKPRVERGRFGLTAVALAAGGVAFLASGADAQDASKVPEGYEAASDVSNVASIHVQADGSVELVMADGQSIIIAAADVVVEDGIVYLSTASVDAAIDAAVVAPAGGGGAGIGVLGAVAAGGGLAAAAGGGGGGGASATPTPTPVPNVNPPVFTSSTSATVDENSTGTAYTATATDADGNSISYSIVGGSDAADFSINASTGALTFVGSPDFENPNDSNADNAYEVIIRASDGTNTTDQTVTISVNDIDEAPVFSSAASVSVAENQTSAYVAVAADAEGAAVSYTLSGADAALFSIDASSGVVTFIAAPDHENPADAGGDNVYDIVVRASDGTNTTDQAVAITVTDQNDNAPVFTSATTVSVPENQTSAYDADATDADASSILSYSISGTDSSLFSIDSSTGVVTFLSAPNFEAPTDSGGNGVYDFVVTASDGSHTTDQTVAVTVTDITENGDLPADVTTTATLALGGTYSNQLEVVGDRDWIAVELVAGQRYAISLNGSGADPLSDPLVRLYDAAGNLIGENDDGGAGLNSLLSYTVPTTGTYYVEAAAWDDTVAGSYTVGLETAAPLEAYSTDQIAEFLRSGYWTGNGGAARHWNVTDGGTITVNLVDLTADGQTLARAALGLWSDLTGINFSEVSVGGQMVFDDDEEGAFATTSTSGGFVVSAAVNVSTDWIDTYGTNLNSYSYQTYIHEIGHALGLGHAGPYNGSAVYAVDAAYLNDSWQASVMSYFSQTENTYINASFAYVVSPQIADVLAIQNIYGLAANIRAGDTVYGFNSTAGNAIYDATSFTTVTSYTIVDTGGIDTMDYSGSAANQTLDLRAESHSSLQGGRGNVSIARGTVIENAIGGTGNDTLIGNSANNHLTGNDGNDRFFASGGTNVYDGGAGSDTVVFSGLQTDYIISTNGSGHTVVTDMRIGAPDGVTELISIETIEYGTSAPSLMATPSPKNLPDNISQDRLTSTDWAAMGVDDNGNFRGVDSDFYWGADSLQLSGEGGAAPGMRPLDLAELGQTIQVVGLVVDGEKSDTTPSVMDALGNLDALAGAQFVDTLDVAEKPGAHVDVMPDLSPEDLAQVQLIDSQAGNIGRLLTDAANTDLTTDGSGDEGGAWMFSTPEDFRLPDVSWGVDGLLVLSEWGDAPYPGEAQEVTANGVEAIPTGLDAIQFDDPSAHLPPVELIEGWA